MYKNVGAFTTLFLAIATAMAALPASADAEPLSPQGTQPVQDQSGTPTQSIAGTKSSANSQNRSNATTLATVVVTATKRSESLQKVPMAITALTNYDLQRQHMEDFADYAASVPGLNVVGSPGMTELSIRGINSGSQQAVASIGTYIDDTPFGSSSAFALGSALTPDIDPADLERVEVLRGPQGTLYGAGALGGVIRFITVPPDTENFEGRLQVGDSKVDGGGSGFDVHGMVNLPLVADKLALRANVYTTTTPGFIDDVGLGKKDVNESKVVGGRFSLLWTPTDKTSLRVTALTQNLNVEGTPTVALDPATLQPLYGDLQQRSAALGGDEFDAHYRLYNATLKSDFGWAKLTSSTSYSTLGAVNNIDATALLDLTSFTAPSGNPLSTLEEEPVTQSKFTQEFRLSSPDDQTVTWLGGLFFTHEIGNVLQNIPTADYYTGQLAPSPFGNPLEGTVQPSTYLEYAAYGSATWHVTDRFDVEAGLRYSHDTQHYTEILFGSPALGLPAAPTVELDNHSADSSTTFSLTPRFRINDNNMLYARVASGFLPGGPNVVALSSPDAPKTFSPTQLVDYELGLKSTALDSRLQVDLSAYHIDWTKIPLIATDNKYTYLTDGAQATSNGLEASIAFIPVRGLKFSLNGAYNDATLSKDVPYQINGKKGDPLPYAPKFTAGLNGDYDFALGGNWHGYVGASYQHIGPRSTDFASTGGVAAFPPSPRIPGYNTLDFRAGVSYAAWNIDFYVKNATNKRGIVEADTFSPGSMVAGLLNPITGKIEDNAQIITPRLIGISVSRTF